MHVLKWRNPTLAVAAMALLLTLGTATVARAQAPPNLNPNEPGILEPVLSHIEQREVRIPNTDQSIDGNEQTAVDGSIVLSNAIGDTSLTGHEITSATSPNDDMRDYLFAMQNAAVARNVPEMQASAQQLLDVLLGTTQGKIYDGFAMLNFNRWKDPRINASHFGPNMVEGEYKMRVAQDTGETFISPYDGEERKIWEVDIAMLYYDGQIDSDIFLVKFPFGHHDDDVLHVNYTIYSMVREDFSPTLVALDKRKQLNTVQFPFKGLDSVWIAFEPQQVLRVTVKYPPIRQVRGVYTWGWRVHPPRIQFMQPIYEIRNAHTGEVELDPQGASFAFRNREDLTLDSIADEAPEMKMYKTAMAALNGTPPETIEAWMTQNDQGPAGTWFLWADFAKEQRQLPLEAWELLAQEEGLSPGDFGEYQMITVYMNNEMYGAGPAFNAVDGWDQQDEFKVKLINFDKHTHYFRNVDFSARQHDDILRCCGGGETSFEIMNFKPSYGAPKVAEMQWRAGWGFRPHFDVIQQSGVFPRGQDRIKNKPYFGGEGGIHFGYQYSEAFRGGDFVFNPPPFIIGEDFANPSSDVLREEDGTPGLLIGQFTEGYGTGQMCGDDPYPGFCTQDIQLFNPHGVVNFPPPPLRGQPVFDVDLGKFPGDVYPNEAVELRFPPFLRNPAQTQAGAGDIIPPTGAWRPFLWYNPANGSLFIDPDDPSQGHWVDLTFSHGTPVFANGGTLNATIELPRASGQVFYQFDDLFHDNSIFSPHPLFSADSQVDPVSVSSARLRGGELRVSGQVDTLSSGEQSAYATLYHGGVGANGCLGETVALATVGNNGRFVFRVDAPGIGSGDTVCVQTVIGGTTETTVQ